MLLLLHNEPISPTINCNLPHIQAIYCMIKLANQAQRCNSLYIEHLSGRLVLCFNLACYTQIDRAWLGPLASQGKQLPALVSPLGKLRLWSSRFSAKGSFLARAKMLQFCARSRGHSLAAEAVLGIPTMGQTALVLPPTLCTVLVTLVLCKGQGSRGHRPQIRWLEEHVLFPIIQAFTPQQKGERGCNLDPPLTADLQLLLVSISRTSSCATFLPADSQVHFHPMTKFLSTCCMIGITSARDLSGYKCLRSDFFSEKEDQKHLLKAVSLKEMGEKWFVT